MSSPVEGIDQSDAPYVVVSSDTHAGPPSEAYRDYIDPAYREAFDRDLESALALRSLGLNHGLVIGVLAGLLGFIPYFGSLTGLVLSVGVAIVQFGLTWPPILIVLGIFLVGQTIADYVLAPYFVGSKVHLNPVWLLFALFSFGYLFGFIGLLIAVPQAAAIGVLVRFALRETATRGA